MKRGWPFGLFSRRPANGRSGQPTVGPQGSPARLEEAQIDRILAQVRPFTMVHDIGLRFTIEQTIELIDRGVKGAFMECGVWRGGSSMAMLLAQRAAFGKVERPVYMLDSFEGLPPVTVRDGPLAADWKRGGDPANYLDNCQASLEELQHALKTLGFSSGDFRIVPGWFNQSVPALVPQLQREGIALLRLDGDWYDSTMTCLEHLVPLVAEGGIVILDDYYAWDGCARAAHDYLSRHDVAYRIRSLPLWQGAYFFKKPYRDRFDVL